MRQASGDLFPTDVPIPASQMIGRRDDVREVTIALLGATNLVMAGPRRTGKTSVCEAALNRCRREGAYAVHIDLFRIADAAELCRGARARRDRQPLGRPSHRAPRPGAGASGRSARPRPRPCSSSRASSERASSSPLTPGWAAQDPQRALDLALELPERVAVADGKRLILFFDEFQELASERRPYGDPDQLTKRMRAIFQRSTSVSHLFAGSLEHVMRDLFAPQQRAFSGFGSFHALRPISTQEWCEGLTRGSRPTTARSSARRLRNSSSSARATLARRCGSPSRPTWSPYSSTRGRSTSMSSPWGTRRRSPATCRRWSRPSNRSDGCTRTRWPSPAPSPTGQPPPRRLTPAIRDRVLKLLERAGIVEHVARGKLADRQSAAAGVPAAARPPRRPLNAAAGVLGRSRTGARVAYCVLN